MHTMLYKPPLGPFCVKARRSDWDSAGKLPPPPPVVSPSLHTHTRHLPTHTRARALAVLLSLPRSPQHVHVIELSVPRGVPGLCVVRDANMGHQLAGGHSSWCPELESRTTQLEPAPDETAAARGLSGRQRRCACCCSCCLRRRLRRLQLRQGEFACAQCRTARCCFQRGRFQ